MRKFVGSILLFCFALLTTSVVAITPALADSKHLETVVLEVDDMTCNMCPITVKKALRKLDGVEKVTAKYEGHGEGWAKVTYDPHKVSIDDLTFTTEEAGYPSRVKQKL